MANLDIQLHSSQFEVFNLLREKKPRVAVLRAGRRWGKTRLFINYALIECLSYSAPTPDDLKPVNLILAPTFTQSSALYWSPLMDLIEKTPLGDVVSEVIKSERRIKFKGKNSLDLVIAGLGVGGTGDNLRGKKLYLSLIDEAQDLPLSYLLQDVVLPASETEGAHTLIAFTPKGRASELFRFEEEHKNDDEYLFIHKTTLDNPLISPQKKASFKRLMPPEKFEQECLASWTSPSNAVFNHFSYTKHLFPFEPTVDSSKGCFLSIDPGATNCGIVKFCLDKNLKFRVIDGFSTQGVTTTTEEIISEVVKLINSGDKNIKFILIPDDRPDIRISIINRLKQIKTKNKVSKVIQVSRREINPDYRIDIGNSLLYRDCLFFDKNSAIIAQLADELASLSRKVDKQTNLPTDKVDKSTPDHMVDALFYGIGFLVKVNKKLFDRFIST